MNDEPAPAAPIPSQTQPIPPTEIKWVQGGEKVYVTGSFTGWRKMIGLVRLPDGSFSIKLALPPGTHRFRFVVDNELRFSDVLPTATDQMGNFVNYIEVASWAAPTPVHAQPLSADLRTKKLRSADSKLGLTQDDDDMGGGYTRYHDESHVQLAPPHDYTHHIPAIFTDPKVMEQYYLTLDQQQRGGQQQWLIPPQLPPHLENVILNNYSGNDSGSAGLQNISGALPIPNHVVLNHLATTSIKHNTLAVASIVRYKQKYSTQILYAPLQ
ncbi:carbohydrate-binding module family 48 protein [Babjeviella inositovora NRRL Y-12698]|uniref:Carbohydrate-binding module family 48 protein n=1 Tax=Babjeviella inositovora NRRL Y-12698 TaxID=984486 RepID=A0A1E3QMW0_9ASCO|nr:carbohydrate-binding module family 48 protein [Babjeviella inositovora NRRL Y-12698]ODQ79011.1 carbohydrate-binding module family 48 protein [Babjeviella inositovora NRRL Y-12698]